MNAIKLALFGIVVMACAAVGAYVVIKSDRAVLEEGPHCSADSDCEEGWMCNSNFHQSCTPKDFK